MNLPTDTHLWTRVTKTVKPKGMTDAQWYWENGNWPLPVVPMLNDASWMLDLHGYTVEEAHRVAKSFIERAALAGRKSVLIITGRSGEIRREFPTWAELHPNVRSVSSRRGDGSFDVKLKRPRAQSPG